VLTRARVRTLVGVALTLAILVPLGWVWWASLLPSSYSVMDMGYADYGGGSRPAGHDHDASGMDMAGTEHTSGGVSVASLDTPKRARPDVTVNLTTRQGRVKLASGRTVEGYTVNGTSPGPTIEATVGQLVEVRVHNDDVEGGVALHWHGVDVPNAEDGVAGVTQDAIEPGQDHVYRWVAPHAGTFWYHSHQMSNEQVSGGLLGGIVIHPAKADPGVVDQLAVSHLYDSIATLNGDTGFQSVPAEPGQRVRVRVVNADNGPSKAWASVPFKVVAMDGYDVHDPTDVTGKGIGIPGGGRADLEVTVPEDGTAARVEVLGGVGFDFGPPGAKAATVKEPGAKVDQLRYGSPADTGIDVSRPDRDFEYSIGRKPGFIDGRPGMWWSINGHLYPDMPMAMVREGDVVKVTISNHGHHAIVLSRDGTRVTGSPWWFDSLDVQNGETFEVAFVADNPGIWMDHCHNLKHAAQGMVTHLMYEGVTTPYKLGSDSGNEPE
jgi:FtsP/CotA-like multicopper oxidase with cupredoxin domain